MTETDGGWQVEHLTDENGLEYTEVTGPEWGDGRYIRGGDGTHWQGCEETHYDCKIAKLEAENTALKAIIENQNRVFTLIAEHYTLINDGRERMAEILREWGPK